MGVDQSSLSARAPWQPAQKGYVYPLAVEQKIRALSENGKTFLAAAPGINSDDFSIEKYMAYLQGAMKYDSRLSQWLSKLVPKRVTEDSFWRNYFSHVQAILANYTPVGADPAATAAAAAVTATPHKSAAAGAAVSVTPAKTPATAAVLNTPAVTPAATAAASTANRNGGTGASPAPIASAATATAVRPQIPNSAAAAASTAAAAADAKSAVPVPVKPTRPPTLDELMVEEKEPVPDDSRWGTAPIRWGIIGCGDVCEIKSGPAFSKCRGSTLVAVMRRTESLAKAYAVRHSVPKYYTDAASLIHDAEVDAVYIATPPGTHALYAGMVLAAGKICYVEKPAARSADEVRVMCDDSYTSGVPLYVGYYRRTLPRFIKLKALIQHHIGLVTSVQCTLARNTHLAKPPAALGWRIDAEQSGGGLFMDLASHTLDALDFLFGPLGHVSGDAVCLGGGSDLLVESCVSMTFRLPNGAPGVGLWNFVSALPDDKLVVNGTAGTVSMSIFGTDGPTLTLANGKTLQLPNTLHPAHVHQPLVQQIVNECRRRRAGLLPAAFDAELSSVPSTGETALRTAVIMDAVLRKFYRSRSDHFWQRSAQWERFPAVAAAATPASTAGASSSATAAAATATATVKK